MLPFALIAFSSYYNIKQQFAYYITIINVHTWYMYTRNKYITSDISFMIIGDKLKSTLYFGAGIYLCTSPFKLHCKRIIWKQLDREHYFNI